MPSSVFESLTGMTMTLAFCSGQQSAFVRIESAAHDVGNRTAFVVSIANNKGEINNPSTQIQRDRQNANCKLNCLARNGGACGTPSN